MSDGWISTSDRLPDAKGMYIVAAKRTYQTHNFDVFSETNIKTEEWATVAFWQGAGRWDSVNGNGYGFCYPVTHWMPLPAPPKED